MAGSNIVEVYTRPGVVSIQWIADNVGIVRYHGTEGGYGSPFSFSVTMKAVGDVAEFYAGQGHIGHGARYSREIARAVHRAMRGIGMRAIHYERRRRTTHENTIRL